MSNSNSLAGPIRIFSDWPLKGLSAIAFLWGLNCLLVGAIKGWAESPLSPDLLPFVNVFHNAGVALQNLLAQHLGGALWPLM